MTTRHLTWTQPRLGASALDEYRDLSHREPGWHRLLPDMGTPDPFGYERQVVEAMVRGLQALAS